MSKKAKHSKKIKSNNLPRVSANLAPAEAQDQPRTDSKRLPRDHQTIHWKLRLVDVKGIEDIPNGSWSNLTPKQWTTLLETMKSLETMTFVEVFASQAGDNGNHVIEDLSSVHPKAIKRLEQMGATGFPLHSLRIGSTTRVYCIKEHSCLLPIWYDPEHRYSNRNAILRVEKKHS